MPDRPMERASRDLARFVESLRVLAAIRLSFDLRKVVLGAIGLWLLDAGWALLDRIFPDSATITPDLLDLSRTRLGGTFGASDATAWEMLRSAGWWMTEPPRTLLAPLLDLLAIGKDPFFQVHALLGLLWALIVWGLFGSAIARLTVVEADRNRRLSVFESLKFSVAHARPLASSSLTPLCVAFLGASLCAGFGLLFRLPGRVGEIVGGSFLFVPLIVGLLTALILLDFVIGWSLTHASIAAEGCDGIDAVSRAFSFVNRRPLSIAFLFSLAWSFGTPALIAVEGIRTATFAFTARGLEVTAPAAVPSGLVRLEAENPAPSGPSRTLPAFWKNLSLLLVEAWLYAYYWTASALIYLVIRRDLDGTPWESYRADVGGISPKA